MRADWIFMTHNGVGGTSNLTCVQAAGWPTFAALVNVPRIVEYTILQFTDTTQATIAQAETGRGLYAPGTGVLSRDHVLRTWDGANYLPRAGSASAPVALTISANAANVRITCAPTVESLPAIPFVASSFEGLGTFPLNFVNSGISDLLLSSGEVEYTPILIGHEGPFSRVSVHISGSGGTYSGGTQSLEVGIYEIAETGLPGKKLIDFGTLGGASPFSMEAIISSSSLATPVYLEPGWYWQAILAQFSGGTGAPRIRCFNAMLAASPAGTRLSSGATTADLYVTAQTSLADPAPAGIGVSNNGYTFGVAYQ